VSKATVGLTVTHRRYVPYSHAHYAGNLVDGAYVLALFGDVATEVCIQSDGDEGLFASYSDVQFLQPLRAGDVVCFPGSPEGAHTVHGPGRVLMLSDEVWPAVVVYPDSDKVGARPGPWGTHTDDRGNFRRSDAVDYWDGEQ